MAAITDVVYSDVGNGKVRIDWEVASGLGEFYYGPTDSYGSEAAVDFETATGRFVSFFPAIPVMYYKITNDLDEYTGSGTVTLPGVTGVSFTDTGNMYAEVRVYTDDPNGTPQKVEYGPTDSYGSEAALTGFDSNGYSVNPASLSPTTSDPTFHYRVISGKNTTGDFTGTIAFGEISNVEASDITETTATITWDTTINGSPYTGWTVGSIEPGGDLPKIDGTFPSSHEYIVSGLTAGTEYVFTATTYKSTPAVRFLNGDSSNPVTFTTTTPAAGTTTQEPVTVNPSKITSGQNSGQAGSVFSSRVDEYNETTTSLSSGGDTRDISNIDDNTKSSTGTQSGGVINDGGNDVVADNAIEPAKTIPNAGNRFSR